MATTEKRIGYATEDAAYQAAVRRGQDGLTGPGQQCCPIELPDGSWGYWTTHNYFRPARERGRLLLPRKLVDLDSESEIAAALGEDWDTWMYDVLGVTPSTFYHDIED